MGFLAPLYLALGAAAAVPVLLHFLRRQTGARITFPAARYLARAEQEHSRRLRLRHLLLMLLRVLAILLLAAAAAGPIAAVGGAGHPPVALAVVLDNSLSTTAVVGGAPTFDALRAAAASALSRGAAGDRLWLVTADGVVRGGTPGELARAAALVRPLDGAGNLRAAVERGAALARAAGLPTAAVAVVTDAQASAWRTAPTLGRVRVAALTPSAAAPANRGLAAAEARPARWAPSGTVFARVVGSAADSVAWRIALAAPGAQPRTVARGAVRAAAAGDSVAGVVQARVASSERGWIAGVIATAPDEFRGDDSAFFAAFAGDPPAVRAASESGPFVAAAIASIVASGQARPPSGRVVTVAPADAPFALPAVLFAPGSPVGVGAANRALERAGVPWRFGSPRSGAARLQSAAGAPAVGEAQAALRYALSPAGPAAADARVLATAAGEPWAVSGPGWVLVASPADPAATTLPVLAPWVPWLAAAVSSASGGATAVVAAARGAPVAVPAGATALVDASGAVVAPVRGNVAPAPTVRGVYFFTRGAAAATERLGALVVNLEAEELVLERVRDDELRRRLVASGGANEVLVTHDAGEWSRNAYEGGSRRPIAAGLLALALVALVAESAAARVGRRGQQPRAA